MISAWGVEHGDPIAKSLVGQNKFVPAVKMGAKGLKNARKKMLYDRKYAERGLDFGSLHRVENAPKGKDLSYRKRDYAGSMGKDRKSGVYAPRGDLRTDVVSGTLSSTRTVLGNMTRGKSGTKTFKSKSGKKYRVHVIPGYDNAHPVRYGSRKGGTTQIVAGDKFLEGKDTAKIMRHEVLHADGKSSWRTAQIGSRSRARVREEARADTLSGTYKINTRKDMFKNGAVSHTASNRMTPGRGPREFRRTQDSIFRGRGQNPKTESEMSGVGYSRTYGKPNSSPKERGKRYLVASAIGGTAGGGAAYGGYKLKGRQRRASDGKFA